MGELFLGLGTNLGNRQRNLQRAIAGLSRVVQITAVSPLYETKPFGPIANQPNFLNLCVRGTTNLTPQDLLIFCKNLETEIGREPGLRWGPRLVDVDILLYDDLVLQEGRLNVPHPGIPDRAFVLAPLADIAPDLIHPQLGKPIHRLLQQLEGWQTEVILYHPPSPFAWGQRTYIMGILNITPDSFSGDGLLADEAVVERAVAHAQQFVADGADILDIGGESTRPGSLPVTAEIELARVLPVIQAVRQVLDIPISIDTYRAQVAREALVAGADWVNDVWGLRMDDQLAPLVAQVGCPLVLMHNRSKPKNVEQETRLGGRYVGIEYGDLLGDIERELQESVVMALQAGVKSTQIIIDPGVGFGKTVPQNLQLIHQLGRLKEMGYPILLGTSRKSFIGYTLDLPPDDRLEGTAATVAIGIDRGADIVRVHDVQAMARVAKMTDKMTRNQVIK